MKEYHILGTPTMERTAIRYDNELLEESSTDININTY